MDTNELRYLLKTLPDEVVQLNLDSKELTRRLRILLEAVGQKKISAHEFADVLLDILEGDPPLEVQEMLQLLIGVIGISVRNDRMALYWRAFLYDRDEQQREISLRNLFSMSSDGNVLAYNILKGYLGQEPTEKALEDARLRRGSKVDVSRTGSDDYPVEQRLRNLAGSLSEAKLFSTILDMLDKKPTIRTRETLQIWLGTYANSDVRRFVEYWVPFLDSDDKQQRHWALHELFRMRNRSTWAHDRLQAYFGQEPTRETLEKWYGNRFDDATGEDFPVRY